MASLDYDNSTNVLRLSELTLRGDYRRCRQITTKRLVCLATTDTGQTPLMLAADAYAVGGKTPWQYAKCVELMLEYGADRMAVDESGNMIAHVAARTDNLRLLALLPFDAKFGANAAGQTPLMVAVQARNWRCAKHLLHSFRQDRYCRHKGRLLVQARNGKGRTTLDLAKAGGQNEMAEIIETDIRIFDAVLSAQQEAVRKELAQLAWSGDVDGIKSQANQVNCDLPDTSGRTALWWAVKSPAAGATEVVRLLAEIGDPTAARADGWSCLHWAARKGRASAVRELVLAGAHANCRDWSQWTPLMHAAYHNQVRAASALISLGANWLLRDSEGRTALDVAEHYKSFDVAALLNHFTERSYFNEPIDAPADDASSINLGAQSNFSMTSPEPLLDPTLDDIENNEDDTAYKVTSPPGFCLLITADHMNTSLSFSRRTRESDAARIDAVFRGLNFKVKSLENPRCYDIVKLLNSVTSSEELLHHGCLVCFIAAHSGGPNAICDSRGNSMEIRDIVARFKANQCPNLSDKPKLFFVQIYQTAEEQLQLPSGHQSLFQQLDKDLMICYSTEASTDYYTRDRRRQGSVFVQTLCDVIEQRNGQVNTGELLRRLESRLRTMPSTDGDLPVVNFCDKLTKMCFLEPGIRDTIKMATAQRTDLSEGIEKAEKDNAYRPEVATGTKNSVDDKDSQGLHPRADECYPRTDPQGLCLIINISKYKPGSGFENRHGSQDDVRRVSDLFHRLRFLVNILEDCTVEQMTNFLYDMVRSNDLANHGCFVCFLMAHCSNENIFGNDGYCCSIKSLIERFQSNLCRSLICKPKIFFIQTVQSEWLDSQVEPKTSRSSSLFCPTDSDFLLCYLTAQASTQTELGISGGGRHSGADFIQILCDIIETEHSSADLMTVLTRVNRRVMDRPIRMGGRHYRAATQFMSRLSKNIILEPCLDKRAKHLPPIRLQRGTSMDNDDQLEREKKSKVCRLM